MQICKSLLEDGVRTHAFPGAVLLVGDDTGILFEDTAGRLSLDPDSSAVQPDTIYDVASLTKVVVTTTLVMMLFEEGRLDLDASLPGGFTIRQLLTHSAGLPAELPELLKTTQGKAQLPSLVKEGWLRPLRKCSEASLAGADGVVGSSHGLSEVERTTPSAPAKEREHLLDGAATPPLPRRGVEFCEHPPLQYTPGEKSLYSDVGFMMLGHIIEDTAAARLDIVARDRIFRPLGMADSGFNPAPALRCRIAPTEQNSRGVVHDPAAAAMGGVAGHAGLFSTARDLALFCRLMLRGGKTIELFTRRDGAVAGSTRALGWDTPSESGSSSGRYFSSESFGHTGFTGTSMWIDPKRRLYAVFLTNRVLSDPGNVQIREIRPKLHDAVMLAVSAAGVKR